MNCLVRTREAFRSKLMTRNAHLKCAFRTIRELAIALFFGRFNSPSLFLLFIWTDPVPDAQFQRAWGSFFLSGTLRGFELEKYYRRSAILTPTLGGTNIFDELMSNGPL